MERPKRKSIPFTEVVIKEFPKTVLSKSFEKEASLRYRLLKRNVNYLPAPITLFDIRKYKSNEKRSFFTESGVSIPVRDIPMLITYLTESLQEIRKEQGK